VLNGPGAGGLGGGPTTRAPHEPAAPAVPPVLRPRPKVAVTESPPAQPITGATALQDGAKETKDNESTGTVTAPAPSRCGSGLSRCSRVLTSLATS